MLLITLPANLDQLTADKLRELVGHQAEVITRSDRELNWRQAKIDKLTHEVAYYKRHYFGVKAERLPVEQGQLFEETLARTWRRSPKSWHSFPSRSPRGKPSANPCHRNCRAPKFTMSRNRRPAPVAAR